MFCHGFQALHTETVLDHRPHCCCGTLSYAFQRLAGAVTLDVRPEYKYDIRPQQAREETHNAENAGNFAVKGESFVVPPVVPLSLLQGNFAVKGLIMMMMNFILRCWRGRNFVQYPTSATLATRMCVARTHTECRFLRFSSSLCLPVDGPGFLSERPEKLFLGKKTLGGTSRTKFSNHACFALDEVKQVKNTCSFMSRVFEKCCSVK